ncbi:restriction endonuclease subunit S [Bariatricus sp. HCP3S3_E12]|uniref:restriction endonuclease subunit S n=1 Tax=Bariatricus sp. HCP3S3_E12 TaxID=3438906 RepID=UPI003F8C1091
MGNTPNIRFKGFTDDWEQRKLGATNTFFTDGNYGEAYPKSSDMTDSGSGIPFLTGGNLKDGKLSLDGASYITPEKHSKLTSGHLLEDDIVIAVRGSLGALGYVNTDNSGWNINSQLAILRTDKSELYGKFLIQYLLSWTGQNELLKRQTGSALKQLPIGAIKDVEVPITSIAEQGKIGEYFSNLDNLITLHQRKQSCNTLFINVWEQRKLGATNTFFTDGNYGEAYPKSSDMTDSGSGIPFLTGGNLKDGKLSLDGASYITPEKHSKLTSGHLLEDDIVIAVRGSLGALGYVNTDNSGWNINSQLAILRTDKSELYGKFLIQYLLSWTGQNELLKRQTGSALKQLPIGAIKDVEVPITSIAEQGKIGEYFSNLDNLITLHRRAYHYTKRRTYK